MITIYSTSVCPFCKMAKEYLKKKNVEFVERNVEGDDKALAEMVKKSGQMGVPVIEINEHVIVGFDRDAIDHALTSK